MFGTIRTEQGRLDLKKAGLFGIVTAARVLAIRHHVVERATPARLQGVRALDLGGERDLEAFDEAHARFVELILRQQVEDIEHGRRPTNSVEVKTSAAARSRQAARRPAQRAGAGDAGS